MKKVLLGIIIGVIAFTIYQFGVKPAIAPETDTDKPNIVVSFYPLEEFTSKVGGDIINLINIIPAGSDPHTYQPTPQDRVRAEQADLFIYMGAGLDPFAEKIANQLDPSKTKTIEMTSKFDLTSKSSIDPDEHSNEEHGEDHHEDEEHEDEEGGEEDNHGHGNIDPHIWLDMMNAQKMVEIIENALSEIDPNQAEQYTFNGNRFRNNLSAIDKSYTIGLKNCEQSKAVVSHQAFGYMAQAYGFSLLPITGINPESESSAKKVTEIIEEITSEGIQYIFAESEASTKLIQTIANETNTTILSLNPLESLTHEQRVNRETFEKIMADNLDNLRTGLECK